jgi:3alpha(or 20beta)-hydroxysteroid dehydrogenase
MAGRLDGKVALISGGARGMGAAEARLFVREGARVVIGDVLEEEGRKLASEIGDAALFTKLDVTDEDAWRGAVALARERFGRLDALVNNAGILQLGRLEDTRLEDFEQVIRVNLFGVFLGMKAAIPALRAAGGGSIVNISSVAGMHGVGCAVAYTASKHGVRGMTKTAAIELGADNIRVNSVHPGAIDTPMTRPEGVETLLNATETPTTPIPRVGRPEEVAELALWLSSDASSFSTGSEFIVDGGLLAGETLDLTALGLG